MIREKAQSIYAVSAVFDGIRAIDQDFVRCFLIEGTERAVLIDTCDADADLPGLVGSLTDLPVTVVHTHADSDHIGASDRFAETYMHPSEFALLYETYSKTLRPRPIREGETLRLGGRELDVLLLPGHTPGSIALLDRARRILFSGDTVKDNPIYLFGPGRSLPAYLDSLRRLCSMQDAFDAILPSHGSLPIGREVLNDLAAGAELLLAGKLAGADAGGLPCKLYAYRSASFYY